MKCKSVLFSGHALRRIFERGLQKDAILQVIENGQKIASYPDDRPYPSYLMLGFVEERPLHVVVAQEPEQGQCIVITAYQPEVALWGSDFKTRR